jgi:excisionase family DNA binding protein
MISYNSQNISQQSNTGILINQHITVQAAAEATGYNIQYLRRMLRSGVLKGVKIGQMWLIEMEALESHLNRAEGTSDRRCGPR